MKKLFLLFLLIPSLSEAQVMIKKSQIVFTNPQIQGQILCADGLVGAPCYSFASDPNTGIYHTASSNVDIAIGGVRNFNFGGLNFKILSDTGQIQLGASSDTTIGRGGAAGKVVITGTTPMIQVGGTTSSFPALKVVADSFQARLADDSGDTNFKALNLNASQTVQINGKALVSSIAPTVSTAGTSPSVASSNGSITFRANVGTGGVATTIVMTMPAATVGWNCSGENITQTAANRADRKLVFQASTTTSVTFQYQIVSTGAATAFTASDIVMGICIPY